MNCPTCGVAIEPGRRFCPACGDLYPDAFGEGAGDELQAVAQRVRPALQEKARLAARLEELVVRAGEGQLTPDQRNEWAHAYSRWRDLDAEVTLALDKVLPRRPDDRRRGDRRQGGTPPADDRRRQDRRRGEDRRDPFWGQTPDA